MSDIELVDQLETVLIMALDAEHSTHNDTNIRGSASKGTAAALADMGQLLPFETMFPTSMYTSNISDKDDTEEREYTNHPELLLTHPAEIFGDKAEICLLIKNKLKWIGFRKLKAPPKRTACLGKASHWYELHFREAFTNGVGDYTKRIIPFNAKGYPLAAKFHGQHMAGTGVEGATAIICASLIEDALRKNAMLATVRDTAEIKFPVPLDNYKEVFATREAPLNKTNRRKAILHWVSEHLRKSPLGNARTVTKHTRGVKSILIGGLTITIQEN